jgi:hypothetical protein
LAPSRRSYSSPCSTTCSSSSSSSSSQGARTAEGRQTCALGRWRCCCCCYSLLTHTVMLTLRHQLLHKRTLTDNDQHNQHRTQRLRPTCARHATLKHYNRLQLSQDKHTHTSNAEANPCVVQKMQQLLPLLPSKTCFQTEKNCP